MKLLVGLGNPGREYENTRHNFGFIVIDEVVAAYRLSDFRAKGRNFFAQGDFSTPDASTPIIVIKPQTYMNLSGPAVAEVARFHKIPPADIIVFHDDLDLKPGQIRIKQGGGHGGHNGLKSLDAAIGKDYWRVRLGIGHPGAPELVSDYVLSRFSGTEQKLVDQTATLVSTALPWLILHNAPERMMTQIASTLKS
jgi:PTH1 family peptidyl-tRNA hydrolase